MLAPAAQVISMHLVEGRLKHQRPRLVVHNEPAETSGADDAERRRVQRG
jgi:hypothetical protein